MGESRVAVSIQVGMYMEDSVGSNVEGKRGK